MYPAVSFHVVFCGMLGVLDGMHVVAMGKMCVVGRRLVIAFVVMPSGFTVVARSVLVVLRCLVVMMCSFVRHANSSPFHCVLAVREDYGHRRRWRGYRKANWV